MSELLDAAAKEKTFVSTAPHLTLLDRGWYNTHLKPLMVRWMMLWLSGRAVGADQNHVAVYLTHGALESPPEVIRELKTKLSDASMKMLNLSHVWIGTLLPFVLSKTNRVAYGLLLPEDIRRAEASLGIRASKSRRLLSVPFVGKDEPSATSEFSHPDIRIGLSILSYKYEGLRRRDFGIILRRLMDELSSEFGPIKKRIASVRWATWVQFSGI